MAINPAADVADPRCLLPAAEIGIRRGRLEFRVARRPARRSAAVVAGLPLLHGQWPFRHVMLLKDGPGECPSAAPLPGMNAECVAVLAESRHQLRQHATFVTVVVQHLRRDRLEFGAAVLHVGDRLDGGGVAQPPGFGGFDKRTLKKTEHVIDVARRLQQGAVLWAAATRHG
jgi:hypothetical protein